MFPSEYAALSAQLDALHEDVLEVKELARTTNGRVRKLEIWRGTIDTLKEARETTRSWWASAFFAMVGATCGGVIAVLLHHI